jgi:hypothetical protein
MRARDDMCARTRACKAVRRAAWGSQSVPTARTTSAPTPVAEESWAGVGGSVPQACGTTVQFRAGVVARYVLAERADLLRIGQAARE